MTLAPSVKPQDLTFDDLPAQEQNALMRGDSQAVGWMPYEAMQPCTALSNPAAQSDYFITCPKHPCHQCRLSWGKPALYYLCNTITSEHLGGNRRLKHAHPLAPD